MPAPRFELPDPVRRLFRGGAPRVQGGWGRWEPAVRDVAARHRVLPLVVDADGLLALGADGQVLAVRWTTGAEPSPVGDVRTRDLAVLRAVTRYRELRALMPQREPGDMDCAHCRGLGAFEASLPGVVCVCGGLGFFPSRWREPDLEEDPPPPPPSSRPAASSRGVARSRARTGSAHGAAAHAVEPDHLAGSGAHQAIARARAIASSRRPTVRDHAQLVAPSLADPALPWQPRPRRARRLALAVLLALICGALLIGWSAWAASPTSPAASSAPGRP
jgi:hypothetical protein